MPINAEEVFQEAENTSRTVKNNLRKTANWFHSNEGEMFERREARTELEEELDVDSRTAAELISQLVGDSVDPVVQVKSQDKKYVGVAEFQEFEGGYVYLDYHDVQGERKKAVCQRCIDTSEKDTEVYQKTGNDKSYSELIQDIQEHYRKKHDKKPEKIQTGATLASGTTVGGNKVWHAGNDGENSGLEADKIDGYDIQKNGTDGQGIINFKTQ